MRNLLFSRWLASLCLVLVPAFLQAAGNETRLFMIRVDGKPAGECRVSYTAGEDGSETLTGSAAVRVKLLLATYQYRYEGSEIWKGTQIQRFNCSSDEDGKKCTIQAAAEATGLRVTTNGRGALVRADVWPTTYWRLPAPGLKTQTLTLLDVDNGHTHNIRLEVVGGAKVTVAGQVIHTINYRMVGPVRAELWYDAQGRLVRQSSIEDGHRMVLDLKELPR